MAENDAFLRFMAAWALVHETADEGWKAAVLRGGEQQTGEMGSGPEAFVDGLSALIAVEKEKLKAELAGGALSSSDSGADVSKQIDELRFEISSLRGAIESLQASMDALGSSGRAD